MRSRWTLVLVAVGLSMLLGAKLSFAGCCLCNCGMGTANFCVNDAENECTDACGNQGPPCGFNSWSANTVCTTEGCVVPSTSAAPAASSRTSVLLAVGLLGLGALSIRRLAPRRR